MKKALLVKPGDIYSYAVIPNLGLGYIASALRKNGFEAIILDCNNVKDHIEVFKKHLEDPDVHMVGFQVFTSGLTAARGMVEMARSVLKDVLIVAGGAHPSGDPDSTFRMLKEIDLAVTGEAEEIIPELMRLSRADMSDYDRLSNIKNIAFRDKEGNVHATERAYIKDMDDISAPAWDLINPSSYSVSPHGTFLRGFPVAPIITSRGCPYPCTFCAAFRIVGRRIRRRSVDNVLDEIVMLQKEYGVKEIHIEDDNFTLDKEYVMEFSRGIIARGIKIWWACPNGIRLDKIDEEMLSVMEKSGCYSVAFGIESGSDRILKAMKKNLSVSEIRKRAALIKAKTRMSVTGFFLIGYPEETMEDLKKTLELALALPIDKASFSPVMPLPGSELYQKWLERTNTKEVDWNKFLYYQIVPGVSDIDPGILKRYLKEALIKFYLRPRVIFGMLREIKTRNQLYVLLKRMRTVVLGG